MKSFAENRPLIENEFEEAVFDENTGLNARELYETLKEIQEKETLEPRELVCARAYAYLLDHVQLQINEHTPFSVKLNLGIDYTDFATSSIFSKAFYSLQVTKVRTERLAEEYKEYKKFAEVGLGWMMVDFVHTVPDWSYLFAHGFPGILEQAHKSREKFLREKDKYKREIVFLNSVIICYEAILRLLERIYRYSLGFQVPGFSEAIKNLTKQPPKSLYEVMLFSILYLYVEEIGVEKARTLGSIDRLYLPYFEKEREKGCSEDELKELFRYYFLHFTAAKRFAEQPMTLCGSDKDGNDFTNELSRLILNLYDELDIFNPKIQIRCHKNMDNFIWQKAVSMIREGHSSICLVNDDAVFAGYEKIGIPKEDSQNYVLMGCYEPAIMGAEEGEYCALRFNTVKCIEFAINGGKDLKSGSQVGYESPMEIESFEEFFEIYMKQLYYCTDFALSFIQKQGEYSTLINPSPIFSASFSDCIEKGMDVHEYPLKYNNLSLKHHGLATTVDSLTAIKKYVFDLEEISLGDMRNALLQDWKGYEELQGRILRDKEKYGNHKAVPDRILTELTNRLAERYCGKKLVRGGRVRLGLDSVYHCISHGEQTWATPDGRHAGRPISKNLCATDGMDRGGITAYMQSVLCIDAASFVDGVPLDFMLHPSAVEGEKGLNDFISLIRIYFENGGFAVQGNVVSQETLKEAQRNPEKYSTLQVRVCGWNEYFVKLSKLKQDMFIKQCEVYES